MRIFTWHIHGTYLYYLSKGNYTIYIPVNDKKDEGYYGRGSTFPFGDNVIEIPAEEVRNQTFDCILFQTNKNFHVDQYDILSEEQRQLPRVYVEHDPPTRHPTDTPHPMNDPDVVMVHVTHYNRLMWFNNSRIIRVIEHGVPAPDCEYTGEYEKGIVVINHLHQRGRLLGADIYATVSKEIPLELIGMGTAEYGGAGEVLHPQLSNYIRRFRFFFNPIRYTSMGLAVCEAMALGMPIIALATTEYATALQDGVTGYIHTDIDYLIEKMKKLLHDKELAAALGFGAKRVAQKKFDLSRFTTEWEQTFRAAIASNTYRYEETSIHQ
jgi:glycosyltransferase involved in cell wall biosynthesis